MRSPQPRGSAWFRLVAIVFAGWTLPWAAIGLIAGALHGGHGWLLFPIVGGAYGITAGGVFALALLLRGHHRRDPPVIAALLGVAAGVIAIPVLWRVGGVQLPHAAGFAIAAGAITGAVLGTVRRRWRPQGDGTPQ